MLGADGVLGGHPERRSRASRPVEGRQAVSTEEREAVGVSPAASSVGARRAHSPNAAGDLPQHPQGPDNLRRAAGSRQT